MAQANANNNTRRGFLTLAAAASAVSAGALAVAATPPQQACSNPIADDSELVRLEGQIFEAHEGATAYDDEIIRLSDIWTAKSQRLYEEALAREIQAGKYLTPRERWAMVTDMTECREHSRLCRLQDPLYAKMDALIKQMFAMPARTAEGRRAKAAVLLGCILGDEWRRVDKNTEHPERMARDLLIEFVGGEPGEMLRGQFA